MESNGRKYGSNCMLCFFLLFSFFSFLSHGGSICLSFSYLFLLCCGRRYLTNLVGVEGNKRVVEQILVLEDNRGIGSGNRPLSSKSLSLLHVKYYTNGGRVDLRNHPLVVL